MTDHRSEPEVPAAAAWIVEPEQAGQRLERFLMQRLPGVSRGSLRRLIAQRDLVHVDGLRPVKGLRLRAGQQVRVAHIACEKQPLPNSDIELRVIAVTPRIVVVDKPAGIPSHPLRLDERETLANALVARFPECAAASDDPREGGLVHRLDRDTSGVVVAARASQVYRELRACFRRGEVAKQYLALVAGRIDHADTVIGSLEPMPGDRRRVRVMETDASPKGQAPRTDYAPREHFEGFTLLEVSCRSGARHQVRAHLAAVGYPLVGDTLYGGPSLPTHRGNDEGSASGAFLHASRVSWQDGTYEAKLPSQREAILEKLRSPSS